SHLPPSTPFHVRTPRPPRATPFPYTTLFRSSTNSCPFGPTPRRKSARVAGGLPCAAFFSLISCSSVFVSPLSLNRIRWKFDPGRSEEHTSELQSLRHLVCRLLLEKKNKKCML